jgi:hypothetical protein
MHSTMHSEMNSSRQAKLGTGGSNHEVLKLVKWNLVGESPTRSKS